MKENDSLEMKRIVNGNLDIQGISNKTNSALKKKRNFYVIVI